MADRPLLIAGVMSGTSADGIDVVLTRLHIAPDEPARAAVETLALYHTPYGADQRALLLRLADPGNATLAELATSNVTVGKWFALAALEAIGAAGVHPGDVDLIASHGQTICHVPPRDDELGGTLQIGSPSVIAAISGITTAGDFRLADMALGGQGAPLVPYADLLLFGDARENRVALNIGGIANLTIMPAGSTPATVTGFDSGPGGMVIDAVVEALTNGARHYDDGGKLAASGMVQQVLLDELLRNPFFDQPPPRSTGRERFGAPYVRSLLQQAADLGLSPADIVATATALTAHSIAAAYRDFAAPRLTGGSTVITAGGGARNATLLAMLVQQLPPDVRVISSQAYGIPLQAREPLAFALLGYQTLHGRATNLPSVTGAHSPAVLGMIAPGANFGELMRTCYSTTPTSFVSPVREAGSS